jgi:hypothetical protein
MESAQSRNMSRMSRTNNLLESGGQLDSRLALVPSERSVSHACNLLKRDSRLDVTKFITKNI